MTDRRRRATPGAEDLIVCLHCGDRLRSLGPHLYRIHQVSATEYRAEHRLPARYPLMAASMRAEQSVQRRDAMEDDPSITAGMIPGQHGDMARRSAEARSATDALPAVRANRAAAARRAQPATTAAWRARMDAAAVAAGWASMADAITETARLSESEAARRIGVGRATVRRWRIRLGLQSGTPVTARSSCEPPA